MPPLSPQPEEPAMVLGENSLIDAADLLVSGLDRLDELDRQITALNAQKSDVYRDMKDKGMELDKVRWLHKERRLDPIARAERDAKRDAYWRAYQAKQTETEA